jgi:hypothetical protein
MNIEIALLILIIFVPILFYLLIWKVLPSSKNKQGKWGIPTSTPNCPNCDIKAPVTRKPTSLRQLLWGGWTCKACGTEMDKWGIEIHGNKTT